MKKSVYLFFYSILSLSFLGNNAFAANTLGNGLPDLFNPEAKETDFLINLILKPIFGYDQGYNYEGNPFGAFSEVFLSGLLVLAAILTIYTVFTGLSNTANSGNLLNKQGSLTWTTARSVTGVGMLIPLGKSGFCAIQYLVLWLAVQGVLFADTAWEKFALNPYEGNIQQTSLLKRQLIEHSQKIFLSKVCTNAANTGAFELDANGEPLVWGVKKIIPHGTNYDLDSSSYMDGHVFANGAKHLKHEPKIRYKFGLSSGRQESHASICGEILLTKNTTIKDGNKGELWKSDTGHKTLINEKEIGEKINQRHFELFQSWVEGGKIDEIVSQYLEDEKNPQMTPEAITRRLAGRFQGLINGYYNEIYSLAKSVRVETIDDEKVKRLRSEGFAAAGSWFFRMANDLNTLSEAIHNMPKIAYTKDPLSMVEDVTTYNDPKSGFFEKVGAFSWGDDIKEINEHKFNAMKLAMARLVNMGQSISVSPNDTQHLYKAKPEDSNSLTEGLEAIQVKEMANILDRYFEENSRDSLTSRGMLDIGRAEIRVGNPLIHVQNMGTTLLNTVGFGFLALVVMAGGTGYSNSVITQIITLGGSKIWAGILSFLLPIFTIVLTSVLIPAAMMAFYVPLVPFILWMGALFGWLVLVVQALFGAPIWVVKFLMPDRGSFVGGQEQGMMLILSLTLRPVLMVLGFISALHLLTPVVDMLNYFFLMASNTVRDRTDLFAWLFGWLAMLIIYTIVINKTVLQVFDLIHVIPDGLLEWLGGGRGLGDYAKHVEQGVSGASLMAMGGAVHGLSRVGAMAENIGRSAQQELANKDKEKNDSLKGLLDERESPRLDEEKAIGNEQAKTQQDIEGKKADGTISSPAGMGLYEKNENLKTAKNKVGIAGEQEKLQEQKQDLENAINTEKYTNSNGKQVSLDKSDIAQAKNKLSQVNNRLAGLNQIQEGIKSGATGLSMVDGNGVEHNLNLNENGTAKKLSDILSKGGFSNIQMTGMDGAETADSSSSNDETSGFAGAGASSEEKEKPDSENA